MLGPLFSLAQRNRPVRIPDEEQKTFKQRIYFGSSVGLSITQNNIVADLSPFVGFKIFDRASVGLQGILNYQQVKYQGRVYNFSIYGAGVFARYVVLDWLYIQAEYDMLSVPNYNTYSLRPRQISDEIMAGVGFKNGDEKFSYFFNIFYNIAPGINSPYYGYAIPIVYRAGFNVNF